MKCVLILLNDEKEDFSWTNAQKILADVLFKEKLKFFDLKNIE
jgi:hypothetical protein